MNLTLREILKMSNISSDEDVTAVCNKHMLIYESIVNNSNDEFIRNMAKTKIESLKKAAANENITINIDSNYSVTEDDVVTTSDIELQFNKASSRITAGETDKLRNEISKLEESPKKYYLQAALIKASETATVETSKKIIEWLNKALNADPNNYVYKQLVNDVNKSVEKYQSDFQAWSIAEQERIDREKRIETTKKVAGGIGKGLLVVLGAIGAAIAGAFALCCECMGDCDC